MYSAILIDDEYLTCKTFRNFINWEECGFHLAETFTDSRQAIEYLKINKVDLVITDINMPFVTGIDVAKYIYENHPECTVIFLSAYDELEYAKLGMQYNVKKYLNKPISKKHFAEELLQIKNLLVKNTVHSDAVSFNFFSEYFKRIALGSDASINEVDMNFDFTNCYFCIFDLFFDGKQTEEKTLRALFNIFNFTFPEIKFCVLDTNEYFYKIIIFSRTQIDTRWYNTYLKSVKENLFIDIRIEDINYFEDVSDISMYYVPISIKADDSGPQNIIIENAEKYINDHITEDLSLTRIAESVFVSPYYLSKLFKKQKGINISDYIINKKIDYAKKLILNSDIKISSVIEMLGYSSPTYFYSMFKKHTGKTPNEFRKKE